MKLFSKIWGVIIAITSVLAVFSRSQAKAAKQEAEDAKANEKAVTRMSLAQIEQMKASMDNAAMTKEMTGKAHDKNSDGDLTRADY